MDDDIANSDFWTLEFNRCKPGKDPRSEARMQRVMADAAHRLVDGGYIPKKGGLLFMPVVSSRRRVAGSNEWLTRIAGACAEASNAEMAYDKISHTPRKALHKARGGLSERRELLEKSSYRCERVEQQNLILIDDASTSGYTLAYIARAILKTNPDVNIFALVTSKNVNVRYERELDQNEFNNDHIPNEWR